MTQMPQVTTVLSDHDAVGDGCVEHGTQPGQRCPEVDPSGEVCPGELGVEFQTLDDGYPDGLRCVGDAGAPPCSNDTALGWDSSTWMGVAPASATGPGRATRSSSAAASVAGSPISTTRTPARAARTPTWSCSGPRRRRRCPPEGWRPTTAPPPRSPRVQVGPSGVPGLHRRGLRLFRGAPVRLRLPRIWARWRAEPGCASVP